ncbi:phosphonate ABC transporter ATP-binding protein [Acetonema longum]|uniref:Phosphonate ABC transporter, ATPase subunit n=1 Tax=Acetonema longum DSM 6540 TaxID=1009370 RepID=F7NIB3_9FIRM|nr:phosphonate ABC transporter ATP-binding protein [Acetonema longum]EGO64219.1 phosphonate ABC transporter, ATPase subunit [Acetonema longum DSM 6540]
MISPEAAISFQNVYQTYKGPQDAVLKGVNLTIPPSDFCVILGRSGMGKSTLLRCMNGLVLPYEGSVAVCGQQLSREKTVLRHIRRRTGMIFQNYNLVNRLTALENVMCGMLPGMPFHRAMLGLFTAEETARGLALLREVGLEGFADHRADRLSGGQKQRVGIARALAQNPEIILADEPVASLDPVTSGEILNLLKAINRKNGLTVIVSLHQIELARTYGERIIALLEGKVAIDKPAGQLTEGDIGRIYGGCGARGREERVS